MPPWRRQSPPAAVEPRRAEPLCWAAFLILWAADLLAAIVFFIVPSPNEANPVTVFFYHLIGLPGVVLAASLYAALVVAATHVLPSPIDRSFLLFVTGLYGAAVLHNLVLVVWGVPIIGGIAVLACLVALSYAVTLLKGGPDRFVVQTRNR